MALLATPMTIWVAMACWCLAIIRPNGSFRLSRMFWTVAFLWYLAHILFAYHSHYHWSHQVAWEATAQDTLKTVGIDSGVGLLVNFAFLLILSIDLVFQWRRGRRGGAAWIDSLVLFMMLNGAVIFGEGPVRYFGILLLGGVTIVLTGRWIRNRYHLDRHGASK